MSVVDDFLKKMKMVSDDDYDDYDDYDDEDEVETEDEDLSEEEDDEIITPKKEKRGLFGRKSSSRRVRDEEEEDEEEDDYEEESAYSAPSRSTRTSSYSQPRSNNVVGMDRAGRNNQNPEVCMIMPKSFDDANTIADVLKQNKAVVLNLEGIDMAAAQRIIDFASGSCYTLEGNLQKISKKIFIVVPKNMNLSGDFGDLVGDMIDLNSVNMMH